MGAPVRPSSQSQDCCSRQAVSTAQAWLFLVGPWQDLQEDLAPSPLCARPCCWGPLGQSVEGEKTSLAGAAFLL